MATESIRISGIIPATPERIYEAWLNGREHGAMTGGAATVEPTIGGVFTSWDGYIAGRTIELELGRRIVQTWRTTEFPADAPDSRLELQLDSVDGGTRITLVHTDIPEGQGERYESGWKTRYLEPMSRFFQAAARPTLPMREPAPERAPAAKKKAVAKKKPVAKKKAPAKKAPQKKKSPAGRKSQPKKGAPPRKKAGPKKKAGRRR